MAEEQVIQAEDLVFEMQPGDQPLEFRRERPAGPGPAVSPAAGDTLNARQRAALQRIRERGRISRADYEELAGGVAPRTAQADLQDLVARGFLRKEGKGPATRYVPA